VKPGPGALLAAAFAASLTAAPAVAAEVRSRQVEGETVYTLRPERRPDPTLSRAPSVPLRAAPLEIEALVSEVSARHGLDPRLVTTVIGVESGFNALAVSPKGARGLMQLMPDTARQYGVRNLHDPRENVEGGVAYLKDLTLRYGGDLRLALAAYNAGPEAVQRASGVPNFRETRDYLRRIESRYGVLSLGGSQGNGGTRSRSAGTSIRTVVGDDGELTFTNAQGPGLRVVQKRR
jgi:soluble lytic murein transglycosylase-like protein